MAEKIDQNPTPCGTRRQWQVIVLCTGPTAAENGCSNEAMVACARLFSRLHGFRWDHLLTRTNPRRKRDNRIIKDDPFLLEARIELVPAGTVSGTLAYRSNNYSKNKESDVAPSVCHAAPVQQRWAIRWIFALYGEPLTEDAISRLRKRWERHRRNRDRSGVSCSVEPVENDSEPLNRMQLYRIACLELPGAPRVKLARLISDCGLKRVFRLGAGRGQLKKAKRLWKVALEITDHYMFADEVSQANWAEFIVGARNWHDAMLRLTKEADRECAYKYRWKYRREVVFPDVLRRELLADRIALLPRPIATTQEEKMDAESQRDNQSVRTQIEELARIVRAQHEAQMGRLADIETQIETLSRDLRAGRITRTQFDHYRKKLEERLSKWGPSSSSVQ